MRDGVTVVIPAYNEAANIAQAVRSAAQVCRSHRVPFEIIVVNDGSRDETGSVAQDLSLRHPYIRAVDGPVNRGFGYAFRQGLKRAVMPCVALFPADNEMTKESFSDLIAARSVADCIFSYTANPHTRTPDRRILSWAFITLANALFGLHLRGYTGPFLVSTRRAKQTKLVSDGFTLAAEIRVRLIRAGCTYREIPFTFAPRAHGRTSIFRLRTVAQTIGTLVSLLKDKWF